MREIDNDLLVHMHRKREGIASSTSRRWMKSCQSWQTGLQRDRRSPNRTHPSHPSPNNPIKPIKPIKHSASVRAAAAHELVPGRRVGAVDDTSDGLVFQNGSFVSHSTTLSQKIK